MNGILAVARKDLLQITRDKAGAFWRFGFPLLLAIFFGVVFGGGGGGVTAGISVVVVDEDRTELSEQFVQGLSETEALDVRRGTGGENPRPYTRDDAREHVRRGWETAYLIVPEGFGEALRSPFRSTPPEVAVGIDPSRGALAAMIEGVVMQETFAILQDRFSDTDNLMEMISGAREDLAGDPADEETAAVTTYLDSLETFLAAVPVEDWAEDNDAAAEGSEEENASEGAAGWKPVTVSRSEVAEEREGPRSGFDVSFPQALIWALLGGAASFGMSLIIERNTGTLVRLRCAPLSRTEILGGKSLGALVSLLAACALLTLIVTLFFGIRPSSWMFLALSVVCGAWMFTGVVMLLSQFGKTEEAASGLTWGILLVLAMFGGGMIPLFVMPDWMQSLSMASPVRWVAISVEGALWRDFSPAEMLPPLAVLLAIGTVAFGLGVKRMRWG